MRCQNSRCDLSESLAYRACALFSLCVPFWTPHLQLKHRQPSCEEEAHAFRGSLGKEEGVQPDCVCPDFCVSENKYGSTGHGEPYI